MFKRRGILFILSAPSGAGKTTLYKGLRAKYRDIRLSVSYTTRARRTGEVAGRDYHFLTPAQFERMRDQGQFAEWAKVHGFYYGTPRAPLDASLKAGRDVILDIDVQGAGQIKRVFPEAVAIFVLPPSLTELRRRLATRGTDDQLVVERRLANARGEMREIIKYDYYVVNRAVPAAVASLISIVEAERASVSRVKDWQSVALGLSGLVADGQRNKNKRFG